MLQTGDKVLYFKNTCEMVSIIKVHNDDPEEPYFTIQLADGTEKQTVKKYLGSYAFSPFKKENIFIR